MLRVFEQERFSLLIEGDGTPNGFDCSNQVKYIPEPPNSDSERELYRPVVTIESYVGTDSDESLLDRYHTGNEPCYTTPPTGENP